jgi:hypothetical protein
MATLAIWRTLADEDAQDLLWGSCRPTYDIPQRLLECPLTPKPVVSTFLSVRAEAPLMSDIQIATEAS